ncbi:hypothetical protein D5F01_LYC06451 [Larimichthys crocea]|uniref:Uncharacterized protein n=1 Tax=Larimichthys crocea TaxID=215358 RepID=A0A6G0IVG8_LARCR|nr:hypothetical protein D5F01_LYC06451 [Larimichthys crocea]
MVGPLLSSSPPLPASLAWLSCSGETGLFSRLRGVLQPTLLRALMGTRKRKWGTTHGRDKNRISRMNGSPSAACAGNSSRTLKSLNEGPALRTLETKKCGIIGRRKEERNTLEEGPVLAADGQRTACLDSVLPVWYAVWSSQLRVTSGAMIQL